MVYGANHRAEQLGEIGSPRPCNNISYAGCRGHTAPCSCTTSLTIYIHMLWPRGCPRLQQCAAVHLLVYDSARGSVRLCGNAAVCGSAAVCSSAVVCDSAAVCGSVRQCVAVCGSVWQYARGSMRQKCVAVCGSVRGIVWQCALRIYTQSSRSQ